MPASSVRALSLLCSFYSGLAGLGYKRTKLATTGKGDLLVGEESAALQRGGLFLLRSARAVSQSCPNNPREKEEGGLLKDPLLGVG